MRPRPAPAVGQMLVAVVMLGVAAGCTIAQSDNTQSDGAQSVTAQSDTAQPDTAQPDTAQSDTAPAEGSVSGGASADAATGSTPNSDASSGITLGGASGAATQTVWLADLTSPEIRQRLDSGTTTIIIPTGGIEQNGPHMALDKHQVVVAYTAERIATAVGNTLVAPVMAYVPEGDPAIMDNHLQWPGTISVTEGVFAQVLESVATSLANEGFMTIAFLGDSGSSQAVQAAVAADLSARWADRSIAVINLDAYYQAGADATAAQAAGVDPAAVGTHAAVLDTSQVLALRPDLVRGDQLRASGSASGLTAEGFDGDPTQASATIGEAVLSAKIQAGVAQLSSAR